MSVFQRIAYLWIVLAGLGVCLALAQLNIIQHINWWMMDQMAVKLRKNSHPHPSIKIILIDDSSVQQLSPILGRFPWPRGVYAPIIEFLNQNGVKDIYFDILFSEFEDSKISHQEFVSQLSQHNNIHMIGMVTHDTTKNSTQPQYLSKSLLKTESHFFNLPNYGRIYTPIDDLSQHVKTIPIATLHPDNDGRYRQMPLLHKYNQFNLISLPLSHLQNHSSNISFDKYSLKTADQIIPLSYDGQLRLNWYPVGFSAYSFSGILASWQAVKNNKKPLIDPTIFKNSIVLIGSSAVGLHDLKSTPIHSHLPGVEIQATALSNILNNEVIRTSHDWFDRVLFSLILLLTPYFILQVPNLRRYCYLLLLPLTLIAAMTSLFSINHYILKLGLPLAGFWSTFILTIGFNSINEYLEKKKVKQYFSMYVSPKVLKEITDNYKEIKPEIGKKKEVTILFTDIRNFTSLTEEYPVEVITNILNDYFDAMIHTIQENDGTVDKMIGDAIMAFWNAPLDSENHALKAVKTAQQMQLRLSELNQYWHHNGLPQISTGIGINTGTCIVGNIGSSQRVNYTLIGDPVNITSRLESLCKNYSDNILISEQTHNQINDQLSCKFIDNVLIKGRSTATKIYSPR